MDEGRGLLHNVERPPVHQAVHHLAPVLVQAKPRYAGREQAQHGNRASTELELNYSLTHEQSVPYYLSFSLTLALSM